MWWTLTIWDDGNPNFHVMKLRFVYFEWMPGYGMDRREHNFFRGWKKRSIMLWTEEKSNIVKIKDVICRREDKQLFLKEITNDTIIRREDQKHNWWKRRSTTWCSLLDGKVAYDAILSVKRPTSRATRQWHHWISLHYNIGREHTKTQFTGSFS